MPYISTICNIEKRRVNMHELSIKIKLAEHAGLAPAAVIPVNPIVDEIGGACLLTVLQVMWAVEKVTRMAAELSKLSTMLSAPTIPRETIPSKSARERGPQQAQSATRQIRS